MEFDQKKTEEWIHNIALGNEDAFQQFYEYWYPKVYRIALAITHHDADARDATQETMIELHQSISDLRDPKYFKLWLNRIILSKCNRIFRKKKAIVIDEHQQDVLYNQKECRDDFVPIQQAHRKTDKEILNHMMQKLSPIYSEVLVLMYYEQFTITEIAQILDAPEGTIKSRLNCAKNQLRCDIKEYEARENIKLDFHGKSIEAILCAYFGVHTPTLIPVKHDPIGSMFFSKGMQLLATKFSVLAVSSICGVGLLYTGTQLYNKQLQQDSIHTSNFTPIEFRGMDITSQRQAYYTLMKYVHCEYEYNLLSEEEQKEVDQLRNQLQGKYANLWQEK